MPILKMQKTRFSREYFIIEGIKDVTYGASPLRFYTRDALLTHMQDFITGGILAPTDSRDLRDCWYQTDNYGEDMPAPPDEYPDGYRINTISFTTKDGANRTIHFDGEAIICTDEGKTIQLLRAGGCYYSPTALAAQTTVPIDDSSRPEPKRKSSLARQPA